MSVEDIDFEYVAQLDHEYMHVFLDSQMLIADRMRFAGEIPKLLGNFKRLHREVAADVTALFGDSDYDSNCRDDECKQCGAIRRLKEIARKWPNG